MRHYIILLSIILFAGSCENDLELIPISSKSVDGFYKTQSQFDQAIAGCYSGLRIANLKGDYSYQLTEARSDNAWQQIDYDDGKTSRFTEDASLPVLNTAWASLYNTIMRCNYLLVSLPNAEISAESKKTLEGEARFIRALTYFDLVRYFRGIPLVDKPLNINEAYSLKRATEEEVYTFIINDLIAAKSLLPNVKPKDKPNRATAYSAQGFLGKVYVFQSGYPLKKNSWELAKKELKAVVNGVGSAGFFESYEMIFLHANENKDQAVFSLGCKSNASGEGNPYPSRNAPNSIKPGNTPLTVQFGGSPFNLFLDDDIINSIFDEEGDARRLYSIQFEWEDKSNNIIHNWPFVKKYQNGPVAAVNDWDIDWIMLRYTDVYLLYAEACYFTGDKSTPLDILNKLRGRVGLKELSANDISTDVSFTDWLLKERRKEFCFENQRWFDLVRTDRAFDVMKAFLRKYGVEDNIKSKDQYFYPIPQQETNITGLK